jgi:hypothetical protein
MERTPDTGNLDCFSEASIGEVLQAPSSVEQEVDQREDIAQEPEPGVLGAVELVGADTDGLLGVDTVGPPPGCG